MQGINQWAARLLDHYVPALLAGERQAVFDVVVDEGIGQGVTVPDIYLHVIQPALYRIGQLWAERQIGVAEEHMATDLSRRVLAHLYPFLPCTAGIGKTTVVACVEGELHELGAHVIADFLEMGGFDVRFVGANVPTRSLLALVRERQPHLIALSATCAAHVPALREAIAAVRAVLGNGVVFAAGGQALEGVAQDPDVEIWGGDAYSIVAAARRALSA